MKWKTGILLLMFMLIPASVAAQYDAGQLTDLYRLTLQSRVLTERILTDVVLLDNHIKTVQTRKKLIDDVHRFQDLAEQVMAKVPQGDAQLSRMYNKWKTKADRWIDAINRYVEKGGETGMIFKLVRTLNSSFDQLRANLELLLGFTKDTLDNFERLLAVYNVTERSFASYVIRRSDKQPDYAKKYGSTSGKWDEAIEALKKVRNQVAKDGSLRREMNLLLMDLMFFQQAEDRQYNPLMIYTPFLKFDAKYDQLFELIFKTSQWI